DRTGVQLATGRAVTLAHRLREVPVEIDRTGRLFVDALAEATRGRPEEGWMPRALDRMLKETHWIGAEARGTAARREIARRLISLVDRLELGRPPVRELGAALARDGRVRAPSLSPKGRAAAKVPEVGPPALALRALGDSAAAVRALREALRGIVE